MGQHKTNPVAIAAKEGRLPPKEKNRISKRQAEQLLMSEMERRLFTSPLREYFRIYREMRTCTCCEYRKDFIEELAFCLSMLSKNVRLEPPYFLTREEAEKALEAKHGNK